MERTVSYQREMKHNYLMLEAENGQENSYVTKMLMENTIDGLLKFRVKKIDGRCYFCYEITSRQPLGRLLDSHSISEKELRKMIMELAKTLSSMEGYLLLEHQILLEPEFIYVEPQTFQLGLCMVPGEHGDFPEKLSRLLEYLLGKVDYQDHGAVVLAYGLYRESLKENYGIENLQEFLSSGEGTGEPERQKFEEPLIKRAENPEVRSNPEMSGSWNARNEQEMRYSQTAQGKEKLLSSKRGEFHYWRQVAISGCFLAVTPVLVWWLLGMEFFIHYVVMIEVGEAVLAAAYFWWKKRESEEWNAEENQENTEKEERKKKKEAKEEPTGEMPPWEMVFYEKEELAPDAYVSSGLHEERMEVEPQTVLLAETDKPPADRTLSSLDASQPDIPVRYYPFLIGKQPNLADYILERETVSRLHVRIDETETGYQITDLNSTNGTLIEGRLLEANETAVLQPGMEVQIADVKFRFL